MSAQEQGFDHSQRISFHHLKLNQNSLYYMVNLFSIIAGSIVGILGVEGWLGFGITYLASYSLICVLIVVLNGITLKNAHLYFEKGLLSWYLDGVTSGALVKKKEEEEEDDE